MTNYPPEILTPKQVCTYLSLPRSSLYKLCREGKIPCFKVGKHWRFRMADLHTWMTMQVNGGSELGSS
ncbi:helix-turn-helix domain-containing protein [Thermodesulfobacteriota bacterium]